RGITCRRRELRRGGLVTGTKLVRGRIALVGCLGAMSIAPAADVVRFEPEDLFAVSLAGFSAVVLGSAVVERLDPARAWSVLAPVRRRVVLSFDVCSPSALPPWVTMGFHEVVPPGDLADRLRRL